MILGLVEHDRGTINELSFEMLTLARRLAEQTGAPLHAVVIGNHGVAITERLPKYGVSTVHLVPHDGVNDLAPEAWAAGVAHVAQNEGANIVMASASDRGSEVMAHVAARLNLPLAANCVQIQPGDPFMVTRQRWGGSLLEDAQLKGSPHLLTVAPHALSAEVAAQPAQMTVNTLMPQFSPQDLRVRITGRTESAQKGKVSLDTARVVVGGGRGVGSAEGFKALEELADLLGGAVGCSRAVTSLGWRPHAEQVGQTGTRIAPELYIACGVSGAIQHMVGCKSAKHILAINTDPEAPIVTKADYAVIGDLNKVLPAVNAEVRKRGK